MMLSLHFQYFNFDILLLFHLHLLLLLFHQCSLLSLIYRLLWMQLNSVMRDGCNRCAITGGMSSMPNISSGRMKKMRNVKGWMNTET
jgi:hypothetical protein